MMVGKFSGDDGRLPIRSRFRRVCYQIRSFALFSKGLRPGHSSEMVRETPPQVKRELGRMRAGTGDFPAPSWAPCLDRHLQGETGVLLSDFRFFASDPPGAKSIFWGRFAAKRDSQPRVQFGASADVLDAPDGQ